MAHKKGLGSSKNGRDSNAQRLGVKVFGGQQVKAGGIIVRQRGTRFRPGAGTGIGKDDTIFAKREGTVSFTQRGERRFVVVAEAESTASKRCSQTAPASTSKRGAAVTARSASGARSTSRAAAPTAATEAAAATSS